ncbi:hypothetical protein F0L68_40490 [Solihabitans fulvus]|uniref:Transposase DDE domain-containing protein n=1 Tax=Solihabitans fulvus TaxID=1892852 RepID=A0A5B2W4B2_9PSEU|nr:hypothetical protein F0L68_40490 [Solihabitans fulvus]
MAGEHTPVSVLADPAYSAGVLRHAQAQTGHTSVIKPAPLRPPVAGGFTLDEFAIDTTAGTVGCPAGHTVALSRPSTGGQRNANFGTRCRDCPLRRRCTTAKGGRHLTIHRHHDLLAAARRQAATDPDWQADYRRWRPPVERVIAWLVAGGNRRLRYLGTIKNDAWLRLRAAALNLRRLVRMGLARTDTAWVLTTG